MEENNINHLIHEINTIGLEEKLILLEYLAHNVRVQAHSEKKKTLRQIAGKLQWSGNALDEQRKIRNEW